MREKIKSILEKRKMSVYRLAKETGIPQGTLNNWFRGDTDLGSSKLEKICDVLGLELKESLRKK